MMENCLKQTVELVSSLVSVSALFSSGHRVFEVGATQKQTGQVVQEVSGGAPSEDSVYIDMCQYFLKYRIKHIC